MQAGAGPLPPHQAAHLQGAPVNIQPQQQQPFYVPDHPQGQVAYNQQQQMHLAMQQQQRGNFQPRGVNPSGGGGIQAPAFMQMMPSFQNGPPSMPGRSLTNPIQPHYVTPQLFPMQLPHHMMGPPPPNGPPQHMISVINPTFQPQHMGMMPPENGPMSMSNEGNINQQADGQMMTNPQQIAQQQMMMQTGEYGEQPMMMPYQHMAPPTSMSGPPPVFRGQSQQFFPSSTNQMPPMSIASGQAPPHHIPGHSYMGPLPPSLMGPRNGGGGAPTFPPNPIQPGQNIQPQYYPPGAPQPFYNQQASNMQQPVRYTSPGAMSQRSYSSRGGRGNYRGGYSNQRDNRSISRQTSVNSEAPSMSADDHHRKNSVEQVGYQMDSMGVSSAAGEHQEESERQSANAQAHSNERPSSRNANHFAHPFSAPSSSARRNGSPKNQGQQNFPF
ncbi:hypothetical protein WR25_02815 isoform B [Diploscapter pachys]|uniref:Uncharacterized protein n=1 Tax=Diploscapter pachys TaxID=2018661 RepID=A0A2A2L172_9BILA|nr:hypothetical protein WR25_02815 isoform B [Diploscapter pachys]